MIVLVPFSFFPFLVVVYYLFVCRTPWEISLYMTEGITCLKLKSTTTTTTTCNIFGQSLSRSFIQVVRRTVKSLLVASTIRGGIHMVTHVIQSINNYPTSGTLPLPCITLPLPCIITPCETGRDAGHSSSCSESSQSK